jgi:sterol desaturase/sphingolipid hydroxylase (fatty acid hydroxylase superfamily)
MISRPLKIFIALIATMLMTTFILGLAYSISTGFAGFWGGLPFWVIAVSILAMCFYDFWEQTIKKSE